MGAGTAKAAMPAGTTRRAAALVSEARFEDLPADAVELAKQCILDTLGVSIAGAHEPVVTALLEEAREEGSAPQAAVVGHDERFSLRTAALINGTAGHALDFDDCNLSMNGHVSVVVLPGILALGERSRASGRDLVNAFAAGFETACRVGTTIGPGHYDRGFHATGTVGAVASAAACSRMLRFGTSETANAIGIAGTMAAGLKGMFGTMCKPFHAGRAAENGLHAALLTRRGMQARDDFIECRQGFADTLAPRFQPEMLETLPERGMHIRHNLFKYHAACYGTHGAIECGRLLKERIGSEAGIERMKLEVAVVNDSTCNIASPTTAAEARFSLRHCVGMALTGHDTGAADAYGEASLSDPRIAHLRDCIEVVLVPGIDIADSRLTATMKDGTVHRVAFDATVPERDLAHQRNRLSAKFDLLVEPVIGQERTQALRETLLSLEDVGDLSALVRMCTRSGR